MFFGDGGFPSHRYGIPQWILRENPNLKWMTGGTPFGKPPYVLFFFGEIWHTHTTIPLGDGQVLSKKRGSSLIQFYFDFLISPLSLSLSTDSTRIYLCCSMLFDFVPISSKIWSHGGPYFETCIWRRPSRRWPTSNVMCSSGWPMTSGFPQWGLPCWMISEGKSQSKMDDWGTPMTQETSDPWIGVSTLLDTQTGLGFLPASRFYAK